MEKAGYVYIMANRKNGTIYTGVTSDLVKRVYEHREGLVSGFTRRYGCKRLGWLEAFEDIQQARQPELQIKAWTAFDDDIPPLPQKMTPAQAARLAEMMDYLHRGLTSAVENIDANEDGTEVGVAQIHPDAASMEFHMAVVAERAGRAYAQTLKATTSIEVYGEPREQCWRCSGAKLALVFR